MNRTIMLVSIVILGAVLVAGAANAAEKRLVAYWPMDEGEGDVIKDESGSGHDGTIKGATWVDGKFGKGLAFDGQDDYVDCGETLAGREIKAFTVAAWVKIESWSNGAAIVYLGGEDYASWAAAVNTGTSGGRSIDFQYGRILGHQEVFYSDEGWHHIAAVYDGSYARLYKDGQEVYNEEYTSPVDFSGSRTVLGTHPVHERSFKGVIDEVRIYDRALSGEEITGLYEARDPSVR